ncbi:hypothetical protein M433DRAFT_139391 [Acidomyces richmondensis BFW]|nr:hypothetical protein M433DRAFT_139391 [Acidomyces richmondensis BFW]
MESGQRSTGRPNRLQWVYFQKRQRPVWDADAPRTRQWQPHNTLSLQIVSQARRLGDGDNGGSKCSPKNIARRETCPSPFPPPIRPSLVFPPFRHSAPLPLPPPPLPGPCSHVDRAMQCNAMEWQLSIAHRSNIRSACLHDS